ncbi:MAG: tetratricopeptide repeat protein [Armatimonadetes bacterium]|nr:tetratricopeptide repeat protein [Armatimonadota bacterium]
MRKDPFEPRESLPQVAALEYFTDREEAIKAFERYLHAPTSEDLRVLTFYGVGGIGKTTLVRKLCENLRQARIPHAQFDLSTVRDPTQAYRKVLLQMRCDLESQFRVPFPRFDLCLAVILAREGGEPPPLVRTNPILRDAFRFATGILQAPFEGLGGLTGILQALFEGLGGLIEKTIRRFSKLERYVRKVFKTEDVIHLRSLALRDDHQLYEELIQRFAQDLMDNLPPREGKACRGVLFLDTYEALWSGREVHTAQGRLLDEWVRQLAEYCLGAGVLLVISGRDRLMWDEDNPGWRGWLDQHLLGGLSARDAQAFLSKCGVGPPPDNPRTPLQQVIIECCDTEPGPDISCHPLYLALCAEIVLNERQKNGVDPSPETFRGIPNERVASELANRFLRSLHNRAMELWVTELSLTPRFDETAALALDSERKHHNGRAGWELLTRFSFVEPLPDGFYRMHKTMAEVLQARLAPDEARTLHDWFQRYWSEREQPALAWFYRWRLNPEAALEEWQKAHESALRERRISEARALLDWRHEIALDEAERRRIGDALWAKAHRVFGVALWETPIAPRAPALIAAIEHYQNALKVYTETDFPVEWARIQTDMGLAYAELPTGDRNENINRAIQYCRKALRIFSTDNFPEEWARTQSALGSAYAELGAQSGCLRAIVCYRKALSVFTKEDFPEEWAQTQLMLGKVCSLLQKGNPAENLQKAIKHCEQALSVFTKADFPVEWAQAQFRLGIAYSRLTVGGRLANLRKAIRYYKQALSVFTSVDFPIEWAQTQFELGNAHADLPVEEARASPQVGHYQKAIKHYKQALSIFTEVDPLYWANTQFNLGDVLAKLYWEDGSTVSLRSAKACFEAAAQGYETVGLREDAEAARERAGEIEAILREKQSGGGGGN